MRTSISKTLGRLMLLMSFLLLASSCEDMFKNPLIDKETGEEITVFLLDRNFLKTKLLIRFIDIESGEYVENERINIGMWGGNVDNLITFEGMKPDQFHTDIGILELGYDPNYNVTEDDPLEFTIMASSEAYISAPLFISYTEEGTKDIIVYMNRLIPGKSANPGAFGEPFDMYFNQVLRSGDLSFVNDISSSPTGTAYEYMNLYMANNSGGLVCNNLSDEVMYEDYGAFYTSSSRGINIIPPAIPVKEAELANGDFVFSSVLKSGCSKCEDGLRIKVDRADGEPGTGTFNYLITFSNGDTKSGMLTCIFPSEQLIEPIYYPEDNPAVTIQISQDAQYDVSEAVSLSSPCGGIAEFLVSPKSHLHTYKIINQYVCPDSYVGMALSLSGQLRRTGTDEAWTSFEFVEGHCELQLDPGTLYDFRVPIEGEYYSYTLPTSASALEDVLVVNDGSDYTIKDLEVTRLENKTIIYVVLGVSQEICDYMNPNKR